MVHFFIPLGKTRPEDGHPKKMASKRWSLFKDADFCWYLCLLSGISWNASKNQPARSKLRSQGASFFALFLASWPFWKENLGDCVFEVDDWKFGGSCTLEKMTWNPKKIGGLEFRRWCCFSIFPIGWFLGSQSFIFRDVFLGFTPQPRMPWQVAHEGFDWDFQGKNMVILVVTVMMGRGGRSKLYYLLKTCHLMILMAVWFIPNPNPLMMGCVFIMHQLW